MIRKIEIKEGVLLKDYDLYSSLAMSLRDLVQEANKLIPNIKGRKVWMVNSTSHGGGVAEMMPRLISLLRQLGIETDWVVCSSDKKEFYNLTKKIHNMIHGEKEPELSAAERLLYEEVNRQNAEEFSQLIKPQDIIILHDPQPMGMGLFIKNKLQVKLVWRCHIGYDETNVNTEAAWKFLEPFAKIFDLSIFSAPEYIPGFLAGKSTVMFPSIDPLDHKNRDLPIHKIVGILCNSNLVTEYHPTLTPSFTEPVKRLQPDGSFQSPLQPSDLGLLFKPVILQISRWDRLKGFLPLIDGFLELKNNVDFYNEAGERNLRRLQLCQLVLAGPDPDFVEDDPEGREVMKEIIEYYHSIHKSNQPFVNILKLPMANRKNNELIANALQRVATIVCQNSLKEGFGLTITEAMWKAKPVIGSNTCGIRQQIRGGLGGLLIHDPLDKKEIANKLNYALSYPKEREVWGHYGHKMVIENFLIFTQIRKWLQIFSDFRYSPH